MNLTKYLTVLVVLCLKGGETGGGGKHHDHVKVHVPEFHHHDHHKKVITIHHHHHQPKKEHHHHHHHHHKPHIPHGHHYSHHHKKVHLKTHTLSKGGSGHHGGSHGHHHKHHGHHHKHHGHHGHHGHHHGHHDHHDYPGYGHHYDAPVVPAVSYTPNAIPSYEDEFTPSVSSYDSGIPITGYSAPQIPQVHGVSHTVKQVKVFDSLPGALPNKGHVNGYEVTEEGEEGEEAFVTLNNLQNTYPATFGYVRAAAPQPANDPFEAITSHGSGQQSHDPFADVPIHTSGAIDGFVGSVQSNPFPSSAPTQTLGLPSAAPSAEYPITYQDDGFDEPENSFTGSDNEGPSFITNEENSVTINDPVTFSREAGIQQTTKTGNVETLVY